MIPEVIVTRLTKCIRCIKINDSGYKDRRKVTSVKTEIGPRCASRQRGGWIHETKASIELIRNDEKIKGETGMQKRDAEEIFHVGNFVSE